MTREEFESLKYGDKVCIYERRIGIVIMTFGTSAGKAAKIQVRWEDSGWPNDAIQTEFTIDDKGIEWISKLPEIVSTPPGKDFPNVWTGYVSKEEMESLRARIEILQVKIRNLAICLIVVSTFLILVSSVSLLN